jgi:hypothetical protein
LLRGLLDLGIATREFLLELELRALGRRGFAEQPLGVDEADLVISGLRRADDRREPEKAAISAGKRRKLRRFT